MPDFRFKQFSLSHHQSTIKIGTDSVLLGATAPLIPAHRILDIGCGCGVILFCIAQRLFESYNYDNQTFIGIDISADSIKEAEANIEKFPKFSNQRFQFLPISIQDYSIQSEVLFDIIVSNPPFFVNDLHAKMLNKQIGKHQMNNLSFAELINCAKKLILNTGIFCVILPCYEMNLFRVETKKVGFYENFRMDVVPVEGKIPNRQISAFSLTEESFQYQIVTIRQKDGSYHASYQKLTSEFYLNF